MVECTGLENRHGFIAHPGFKSLLLRHIEKENAAWLMSGGVFRCAVPWRFAKAASQSDSIKSISCQCKRQTKNPSSIPSLSVQPTILGGDSRPSRSLWFGASVASGTSVQKVVSALSELHHQRLLMAAIMRCRASSSMAREQPKLSRTKSLPPNWPPGDSPTPACSKKPMASSSFNALISTQAR